MKMKEEKTWRDVLQRIADRLPDKEIPPPDDGDDDDDDDGGLGAPPPPPSMGE